MELKKLAKLAAILEAMEDDEEEEVESQDSRLPENFYYDAKGLRSLTRVDSNVFRRLLGI